MQCQWRRLAGILGYRNTRAMAGFTLQPGKGRAFIALLAMLGFEDIEDGVFFIFVMTFDAGVGAFVGEFTRQTGLYRAGGGARVFLFCCDYSIEVKT